MGLIKNLGRAAWRKYVTDGVASSGFNPPDQIDIFPFVDALDSYITALQGGGSVQGEWDASADTFPGAGSATAGQSWIVSVAGTVDSVAFRLGDRVAAITASASTSTYASNWIRLAAALEPVVHGGDSGASTANVIAINTDYAITTDGGQLIAFVVPVTNTSATVTVAFNGGSALTIKTAAGNAPAVGGLAAGMPVIGQITNSGTLFRTISDQASSAIQAACEAIQGYAEEWANKPEDSLVSLAAGADGATEYSGRHWAAKSLTAKTGSEAARDLAQGYASDAATVSGVNVPVYASVASAEGATIAAAVKSIRTQFHTPTYSDLSSLVGGANYARRSKADIDSASDPSAAYFRSTDRYMPDGSTDATNGGYWLIIDEIVTPYQFGAAGDGSTDDIAAIQAAFDSSGSEVIIPAGDFDIGAGTLTLPAGASMTFQGGKLSNGTIACDGNLFFGGHGLSSSITLTGTVANEGGVFFDWFDCEKASFANYATFINSTNGTYGSAPSISTRNRIILKMLIDNEHAVAFGSGIYLFDDEITITGRFRISGAGRFETLLWAPASTFLHFTGGGAIYPTIRNIAVESDGSVLLTDAWAVNAIHGLVMENSGFISYSSHTFHNDYSTPGGTGCPIYGSKIMNCGGYAAADMGVFYGWHSGSNVFDNIVDQHLFFNSVTTPQKGVPKALFYNSNVMLLSNSNITYAGLKYVFFGDRAGQAYTFGAQNNSFENNSNGFEAIMKVDAASSNAKVTTYGNQYLSTPRENGYHYILLVGNAYIVNSDSPTPINSNVIRNTSNNFVRGVTTNIDSGLTKYRLSYYEPQAFSTGGAGGDTYLLTPSSALATLVGMEDIYAADSANISYIQVQSSYRMMNSRRMAGGFGTTAARPSFNLFAGYLYFDTTLGQPIWYDGSGWVDSAGLSA